MAPGGDGTFAGAINSSVPGGGFEPLQGTSMATPHVAGAWAVLKQVAPGAGVTSILTALQSTGLPINDPPSGGVYPRINVNAARQALLAAIGAPGAPQGLTATVGAPGNRVTFNWAPPATGAAPTHYRLLASLAPGGAPIAAFNIPPTATTAPVGGVPPGTYFVRMVAVNGGGTGPSSNEVAVSIVPPGAPALNPASLSGRNVTLSWSPSAGIVVSYRVVASLAPGGPPVANLPAAGTSVTVPAPPGTFYVRVHGINAVGASVASNEITVVVP
jgi:hypothetical protein